VDNHALRVTQPLRDAWTLFLAGEASLLDLSRLAEQAANALDHSNAELLEALRPAVGDLEYCYYARESDEHRAEAERIMGPILDRLGSR